MRLIGGRSFLYVVGYGTICVVGIVFTNYDRYVMVLKWMTLSLFAYVAALFAAHVHWGEALSGLLVPRITWSAAFFTTLVAILGTTISPYLFFWQASQEAEDVNANHARKPLVRAPTNPRDLHLWGPQDALTLQNLFRLWCLIYRVGRRPYRRTS
jgi:Mn2+/Fe2+ NRAMP family transporter